MSTQNNACRRSDQTGPSPSSAFAGQTQRGGESAAITEVYRGRDGFEENSREARRARQKNNALLHRFFAASPRRRESHFSSRTRHMSRKHAQPKPSKSIARRRGGAAKSKTGELARV